MKRPPKEEAPALSGCGAGSERDLRKTLSLNCSPVNPWPGVGRYITQNTASPSEAELILDFIFHDYVEREDLGYGEGNWRLRPASRSQIETLFKFGVDATNQRLNRGNAGQLLSKLIHRQRKGLCDFQVARILFFEGVFKAHNLTAREAARLLEALQDGEGA